MFGLRQGVLVMADRQSNSVWTQLDGEATDGPMHGASMDFIPLLHTTWEEWLTLHPDTLVLSNDTPFRSRYRDVQIGMPNPRADRDLLYSDDRLAAEELVLGVMAGDAYVAYPLSALKQTDGILNVTVGGEPIIVFYDAGANSAIAFSRLVDGQEAQFEAVDGATLLARDSVTNTTWDITGRGVAGEQKGAALDFVTSYLSEWYGWAAYHPTTSVYAPPQ